MHSSTHFSLESSEINEDMGYSFFIPYKKWLANHFLHEFQTDYRKVNINGLRSCETRMLMRGHFTIPMSNQRDVSMYLSAFISRFAGSSRSWLCCTSKTSTEVLSSLSGSRVSWLCPASSFRRLLLQNKLRRKGQDRRKLT